MNRRLETRGPLAGHRVPVDVREGLRPPLDWRLKGKVEEWKMLAIGPAKDAVVRGDWTNAGETDGAWVSTRVTMDRIERDPVVHRRRDPPCAASPARRRIGNFRHQFPRVMMPKPTVRKTKRARVFHGDLPWGPRRSFPEAWGSQHRRRRAPWFARGLVNAAGARLPCAGQSSLFLGFQTALWPSARPVLEARMIFHSRLHTAARAPRVIRKMSGTRKDIVVVDLGGSTIKAGFAGDAEPTRCAFPAPSLPRSSRSISMP